MQFSLFGAAVSEPALDDLAGVVLAGGDWVRAGAEPSTVPAAKAAAKSPARSAARSPAKSAGKSAGRPAAWTAARLSIVVDAQWRAEAIGTAFRELSLGAELGPAENGFGVRTDFAAGLVPEAARWTRGAVLFPPAGLLLSARGLRLWAIASGRADSGGYRLGTTDPDSQIHRSGGSQLNRLGLAASAITARSGPGWRVTSAKRLRRLVEILGEPPAGAGSDWPL
jgi:hypothetical protein